MVFEVISSGVFRTLAGAAPAFAPVFQLPPRVASGEDRRLKSAHKIWAREIDRNLPKLRLGDKSIGIWALYLWLHSLSQPTTYC
jgi:hypothetical protein